MNKTDIFGALLSLFILNSGPAEALTIYNNTFGSESSLSEFTLIGESFPQFPQLPPLHEVSISGGSLRIDTQAARPNGPGTNPVAFGRASMMLDASNVLSGSGYDTKLGMSTDVISWGINLSNVDGNFNNAFAFVLASSIEDPYALGADGYVLRGGGMVGDRLVLSRFDSGLGGGSEILIDLTDGLGTLPEKGSFRVTYNPNNDQWSLFGEAGPAYADPLFVDNLLGVGFDGVYTGMDLSYFGLTSSTTGTGFFDNLSVSVGSIVPSPSTYFLLVGGIILMKRFRRDQQHPDQALQF